MGVGGSFPGVRDTDEGPLLESWKEIAAYLKRSEKTCHRWEITLGLPVHRLDGTPNARVFAFPKEIDRWIDDKLHHRLEEEPEIAAAPAARRRIWPRLAAAGVAVPVLGAALYLFVRPPRLLPVPADKPVLAVVQFESAGGGTGLEAWRTAFPDLLTTSLLQSRYVSVLGITDLYRRLRALNLSEAEKFSNEDLIKVAEAAKAGYIVTGNIRKAGDETTVTASLWSAARGAVVETVSARFRKENEVFGAADRLSADLRRAVGLPRRYYARDIVKAVSRVSTDTPGAFVLFSRGYRLAGIAKYQEAVPVLQKAVEADPEFALAYKYLFRGSQNALREDDMKRYARRAVDLSGRLSERERGELVWLYYDYYESDPAKMAAGKMNALERLCRFYPDDRFGGVQLLAVYCDAEEWDKALPVAERAWAINKSEFIICGRLASCHENMGRSDRAEKVLNEFMEANPGHQYYSNALSLRANCLLRQGKFDAARADAERLIARHPNDRSYHNLRGVIALYRGDCEAAERDFRAGSNEKSAAHSRMSSALYLRDLYLMRGQVGEAKQQILRALEIAVQDGGKIAGRYVRIYGLHRELAYLHRISGRYAEALSEIEAAVKDYESVPGTEGTASTGGSPTLPLSVLRLKALIRLDMGRREDFEKDVEEIRTRVEREGNPRQMKVHFNLLGHRELKFGNLEKALGYFNKSLDLVSVPGPIESTGADPEYLYPLAETYIRFGAGRYSAQSIEALERAAAPAVNRLSRGDLYAQCLFELGKAFESRRRQSGLTADTIADYRAKAVEHLRRFVELWKDADPVFQPDVAEARRLLVGLGSE